MGRLVPLGVLGIVGSINSIGAWPAFRQQDISLLHWILASNSEALKGLNQELRSEGSDSSNGLRAHMTNYLTLENMNLSGMDLSSSDFREMSLENVNFAGARLVNSNFKCTDLTRVDFSGAKLMNSKFDYSRCKGHVSTVSPRCRKTIQRIIETQVEDEKAKWPFRPSNPGKPFYTCLEATFVGADFSDALILGDKKRRSKDIEEGRLNKCQHLLVLVGNMSGAIFNKANLTCVALIHQKESPAPVFLAFPNLVQLQNWYAQPTYSGKQVKDQSKKEQANSTEQQPSTNSPMPFSFNGISFTGARLDRVSLLKGPFRFSQFERAKLMGLFLNIGVNKADLDYSRFNEIKCDAPPVEDTENSKEQSKYWPCLLVRRGENDPKKPLHLNLLWSNLVTNLNPIGYDSFLCTPKEDLPAWVEEKRVENAGFWLTPGMGPSEKSQLKLLDCPAANDPEPNNSIYPKSNRKWHHVLVTKPIR
jgi:uncharacterized protein YjbI with pentapeptide repeats